MSSLPRQIQARAAAHQVAAWVPPVARLGYAAKGVVYGLVGWIALRAATGAGEADGAAGALAELSREEGGQAMLLAIALGLLAHVAWRLVQATLDPEHSEVDAKRVGMRLFYLVSAVIYGALGWTAWRLSQGGAGTGAGEGQELWIAALLEQPFGTWLVMLAGIGVVGYGVHQLAKDFRGDVNRRMEGADAATAGWARGIGRIGTGARGLVLLPMGWFVFNAGRLYRADAAADSGEVLRMVEHDWLLALVGLGLVAYGLHQLLKAVYRRVDRPA